MCLLLLEGPSSYLTLNALVTSAHRTRCTESKRIAANTNHGLAVDLL